MATHDPPSRRWIRVSSKDFRFFKGSQESNVRNSCVQVIATMIFKARRIRGNTGISTPPSERTCEFDNPIALLHPIYWNML